MRILLGAQVKMLVRDRQSLFWALVFPLMLLGIFRLFSFDSFAEEDLVVSDRSGVAAGASLEAAVAVLDFLEVEARSGLSDEAAHELLDDGDADAVLLIGPPAASGGPLAAELLHAIDDPGRLAALRAALGSVVDDVNIGLTGAPRAVELTTRASGASETTYFDFLAPGIVGLALLTFSTIGLASSLARYREEGVLRRVRATPLPPWRFFGSLVGSYVLLAVVQIVLLVFFATVLGADVLEGVLALALFALVGNLVFLNLGVVVAGLVHGRYAVEGAANAITFPMMFLSGSFFPTSALPELVQRLVELLPLTHMLRAMRAVSLDGASVWSQAPELAVLLAWVALSGLLARAVFRLQDA